MTYTKKLADIVITTIDGASFSVTDTVECPVASSALASLQSGRGAYVQVDEDKYWIAPNAVSNIKITYEDSEEIEKPSDCEE